MQRNSKRPFAPSSLIPLILLFLSTAALAQQAAQPKAGAGAPASGNAMEVFTSTGFLELNSAASSFWLAPGVNFVPFAKYPWLQAGGEFSFQRQAVEDNSVSTLVFMAGTTVNFGPSNFDSSAFTLGLAMRKNSGGLDTYTGGASGLGFVFLFTKRFFLGGRWCLKPSIGVISTGTNALVVRPLAVSLFL